MTNESLYGFPIIVSEDIQQEPINRLYLLDLDNIVLRVLRLPRKPLRLIVRKGMLKRYNKIKPSKKKDKWFIKSLKVKKINPPQRIKDLE